MKILLASTDLDDIGWAAASGFLDGVMTTPALFREHDRDERDQLVDICRAERAGLVFNAVQGLLAAKAGASFLNELTRHHHAWTPA